MLGEMKQRWEELVQRAATEQDVEKFLELHRKIVELLEQKEMRLQIGSKSDRSETEHGLR